MTQCHTAQVAQNGPVGFPRGPAHLPSDPPNMVTLPREAGGRHLDGHRVQLRRDNVGHPPAAPTNLSPWRQLNPQLRTGICAGLGAAQVRLSLFWDQLALWHPSVVPRLLRGFYLLHDTSPACTPAPQDAHTDTHIHAHTHTRTCRRHSKHVPQLHRRPEANPTAPDGTGRMMTRDRNTYKSSR